MTQGDTAQRRGSGTALAVLSGARGFVRPLARPSSQADFLSQLLAERQRLSPQRARRRAPLDVALDAYAEGNVRSVLRLPAGSYRSRLV